MWTHIAADSPRAANKLDDLFNDATTYLSQHPLMGRPGQIPGTREYVVHEHYRLIYLLEDERAVVLSVIHASRQWPAVSR